MQKRANSDHQALVDNAMAEYKHKRQTVGSQQASRLSYIELLQEEVKRSRDVSDLLEISALDWTSSL